MAKKKKYKSKNPVIFNEKPENIDGLSKLKVGAEVMYRTNMIFDKCKVESVDKENNTAKLSNGVLVSLGILPNGDLLRLGNSTENTHIRLWDEVCEKEFDYFKAIRSIRKSAESFKNLSDSFLKNKDSVIFLAKKLERIKEKLEIK